MPTAFSSTPVGDQESPLPSGMSVFGVKVFHNILDFGEVVYHCRSFVQEGEPVTAEFFSSGWLSPDCLV